MLQKLAKSLSYAFRGISKVASEERNFRLQLVAAAVVAVLAGLLNVSSSDKAVLALAIALVLVLELLNSALERVVDILKPRIHHYVEDVKDIAAGAVLVSAVAALVIGVLIFMPYLTRYAVAS